MKGVPEDRQSCDQADHHQTEAVDLTRYQYDSYEQQCQHLQNPHESMHAITAAGPDISCRHEPHKNPQLESGWQAPGAGSLVFKEASGTANYCLTD